MINEFFIFVVKNIHDLQNEVSVPDLESVTAAAAATTRTSEVTVFGLFNVLSNFSFGINVMVAFGSSGLKEQQTPRRGLDRDLDLKPAC